MSQGIIRIDRIEYFVLDEADRMLDMGFMPALKRILALLPRRRQSMMFSATFSDDIRALATGLLNEPASVEVARRNAPAEAVAQAVYHVDRDKKRDLLVHLITEHNWHQVLVFTRTKHGADALAERLCKARISAAALHGNKSQGQRIRALDDFKKLKINVLVATDIAARGIDIDDLPHVVNYELPSVPEDYVHRIGRTGRAGASGEAVSLVCIDEHNPYYQMIHSTWGQRLREVFLSIDDPLGDTEPSHPLLVASERYAPLRKIAP
jgi:ATP-dependent RNA helicase RhlE